jgi:hypothetical protein
MVEYVPSDDTETAEWRNQIGTTPGFLLAG